MSAELTIPEKSKGRRVSCECDVRVVHGKGKSGYFEGTTQLLRLDKIDRPVQVQQITAVLVCNTTVETCNLTSELCSRCLSMVYVETYCNVLYVSLEVELRQSMRA